MSAEETGRHISRYGARPVWLSVAASVLLAAGLTLALWHFSAFSSRDSIRGLQEAPLAARLHFVGVVTYVDEPGKRFWIQDESGATPIAVDPASAHVEVGKTVTVDATKTAAYDPQVGPESVALTQIRVRSSAAHVRLPQPVALQQFPTADKSGLEVQITAVVRAARLDAYGRAEIDIATSGDETLVIVAHPSADYSRLVNAEIRATGVLEGKPDPTTHRNQQVLWVAFGRDVQVVQPAPSQTGLHSIRTLYLDKKVTDGFQVRLQGEVAESTPGAVVVNDPWGTIDCLLQSPVAIPIGTKVEVQGFPSWDGLRLRIVRATAAALRPGIDIESPHAEALPPLTTSKAVRQLSAARAAMGLPVRIRGTITYVDPYWQQMFIQDQTGGVYLKYSGRREMSAGMRATVSGITGPGQFAPVVLVPRIELEGNGPLPTPVPATTTLAGTGILDSQFVSIEGFVHSISPDDMNGHPILTFELLSDIGKIHVFTSPRFPELEQARRFEDAKVRIHGVLGSVFNARRQLVGYQLLVDAPSQIKVLEPGAPDPFAMPATPVSDLLRFSPGARYGHRVKVDGTVTLIGSDFIYLQDATSGVQIKGSLKSVHLGDRVEAVGYPTLVGRYSPVMTDATLRINGPGKLVSPIVATAETLLSGHLDSMVVSLEGRLLMELDGPGRKTLVLQSGVRIFSAHLHTADGGAELNKLRTGSILRVTGISTEQTDPDRLYDLLGHDPTDFQLLLRSPLDVTVIRPAPFWTMRSILILFSGLLLSIPTILVWVATLRRRIRLQRQELDKAAETAQAIKDLSQSMQRVSRDQRFDTNVSVRGSEDVIQLVIGFNRMLAELKQREREKQAAEAKLKQMAMMDELTGLPNRRLLFEHVSQILAQAQRKHCKAAVLYLDLDGFKLVNDNLGHNIGDLVLAEVAQRLRMRARLSDTLARIGGDEFTLVLDQIRDIRDADAAARGLLETLSAPFQIHDHDIRIGASIGVCIFPDHGRDAGQLLQNADCAMYAAKKHGKNRIVHFGDELGNAARERITLESDLRRAVAERKIFVHYQPEYDLATQTIVRFEALARWTHPAKGSISPVTFIPIAEENGLIYALGAHVLESACRDAVEWNATMECEIQVAVNVSYAQIARDNFVEDVEDTLKRTGLRPELLQLELTESVTVAGIERTAAVIAYLRSVGVSVALDDFGTGYSCLSYLPSLPFSAVKIDRTFVNELTTRPESAAFVQSIVSMAHNLNMRVIVEGIESEAELKHLISLGADEAQGYWLGRPSPNPTAYLRGMKKIADAGLECVVSNIEVSL